KTRGSAQTFWRVVAWCLSGREAALRRQGGNRFRRKLASIVVRKSPAVCSEAAGVRRSAEGERRHISRPETRGTNFVSGMDRGYEIAPASISWFARRQEAERGLAAGAAEMKKTTKKAKTATKPQADGLKPLSNPEKV